MKTEVAVTGGDRAREVGGTLSTLTLSLGAWPPLVMAHVEAGSLMEEARVMEVFMVSGCPQAATCLLQLWNEPLPGRVLPFSEQATGPQHSALSTECPRLSLLFSRGQSYSPVPHSHIDQCRVHVNIYVNVNRAVESYFIKEMLAGCVFR